MKILLRYISGLAVLLALGVPAAAARDISENDLRSHMEILASDAFGGRAPGTIGEDRTIEYLKLQWMRAGIKPAAINEANAIDWFQHVPLERYEPVSRRVSFHKGRRQLRFSNSDIVLVGADAQYDRSNVPLIFVGSGLDGDGNVVRGVKGRAALMLETAAADAPDALLPISARMQALADAGAEAVILVADIGTWRPAMRHFRKSATVLSSVANRAPVQGVVSTEFAVGLVASSFQDWDSIRSSAYDHDFAGRPLGITGNFEVKSRIERFNSHNVVGKLSGRKPGSGAIVYMAHWDHFGVCGQPGDVDRICNGAVDNASGLAAQIEIARHLGSRRHDRDIYFLATTAEESGLLGAYHFISDPVVPLDDILLVLNLDTIAVAPRDAKVAIIGPDDAILRPVVKTLLRKQGRRIDRSGDAQIFAQRQDGWAFAKQGVPAFMVGSAFGDIDLLNAFLDDDYHGPDDELTDDTQLGGAAQDATLHVWLGRHFANTRKFRWAPIKAPNPAALSRAENAADAAGE